MGDESRLRQVVSNLVGNVIAHTPAGSAVRIGVGTTSGTAHANGDRVGVMASADSEMTGAEAVLEIADSGPGLPAEQARLVFERFYRADTSRARDHGGGAGLGLAIVWSLVTAHGGTVELDTAPGTGATFQLRLPAESPC